MLFRNQASAGSFCVCQGHVDALFALKHSESVKKLQICLQMCAGVLVCMKKYVKSVSLWKHVLYVWIFTPYSLLLTCASRELASLCLQMSSRHQAGVEKMLNLMWKKRGHYVGPVYFPKARFLPKRLKNPSCRRSASVSAATSASCSFRRAMSLSCCIFSSSSWCLLACCW